MSQPIPNTLDSYIAAFESCKAIFLAKAKDYGTSWRVYRTISIVDQIYIKAWRIRQIQEGIIQKIADDKKGEFKAIVNYGVMGLILLKHELPLDQELNIEQADSLYTEELKQVKQLMLDKNHDYGEAWRNMSQASFVDLILTKLLRIKQILANDGKTEVSEGIDSNFSDIINYALFALILIEENKH